jgi:uncharacterized protein (DUF697 family)
MSNEKVKKQDAEAEVINEQQVNEEAIELTETLIVVSQTEIDAMIRKRVYAAMALGLAPIPLVDLFGLFALQIELVRSLAKKYEVPFKDNRVKSLVASLVGGIVPVGAAPLFASLVKVVPFVGFTTGAASMSILGGASTYAVGNVFAKHFASGGTLLDLKVEKVQAGFKEQYEKGKGYVSTLKKKSVTEDADVTEAEVTAAE